MKHSRVVSMLTVLALAVGVGWAQVGSFPSASVTGMGNFPAASATSMGHPAPWMVNNGFGRGHGGFGGHGHGPRRGLGPFWASGGYGWGYYVSPWVTPVPDEVLGGSFYNDVNSNMNGRFYDQDQQPVEQYPAQRQAAQQQPAPAQPMVFIIDRDGNMKQADYAQLKHSGATTASSKQSQTVAAPAAATQPVVEDIKTILVYRDGHRREITNYAIMGNKVYLSPHGTVALSELDIPATMAANDERGIDFRVPNATP